MSRQTSRTRCRDADYLGFAADLVEQHRPDPLAAKEHGRPWCHGCDGPLSTCLVRIAAHRFRIPLTPWYPEEAVVR